jgi:thioester reductase-like protein
VAEIFGFEPNVLGTVEILRLALGTRQKDVSYVSTSGVASDSATTDVIEAPR